MKYKEGEQLVCGNTPVVIKKTNIESRYTSELIHFIIFQGQMQVLQLSAEQVAFTRPLTETILCKFCGE